MKRLTALWKFNTDEYTDYTVNTFSNTNIDFLSTATDSYYFGLDRRFIGLYINLATGGSYTGLTYEYYDGETWSKLALIDSYAWGTSKYVRWVMPANWALVEFNSETPNVCGTGHDVPDSTERYWIRVTATAVTTKAVVSLIRAIPYADYTSATMVSEYLQLRKPFDFTTVPTINTVEDMIKRAEDRIDYRTKKSWRFNVVSDEELEPQLIDYNRYGLYPRHRNLLKVYSLMMWDGGQWIGMTEGRSSDFFVNYNLGMVYFTRMFLLPAAYGMTGRYFHWGFGEFKNSIKIEYAYGRNSETDAEMSIVEDIATKLVAKDLLKHHDYSSIIVSGTDKVSLESKVRTLEDECEQRLDELTGIAIY